MNAWRGFYLRPCKLYHGFPGGSVVNNPPAVQATANNTGDLGSIPRSARPLGEGNGSLLQNSCLGNPMDRGALQATVHGLPRSWTRPSNSTITTTNLSHRATREHFGKKNGKAMVLVGFLDMK